MRIIAGTHRGRILHPPKGLPVRPTTDLAKESLFNILNNRIDFEELTVLDLFAGTGNISLEFASRGASEVIAVDLNAKCIDYIRKTSQELAFSKLYTVKASAFTFLKSLSRKFDVIFADPPYDMKESLLLPELVFEYSLLAPEGWLIIEHDVFKEYKNHPHFVEERRYGKVHFSFFSAEANQVAG
ncbi:MAG TPA: 16S rRNA (guanine(966)-N(2))-methyltransferase RsmD [Bacteroidales bacterium]|nr:16S rRNA (guanine(966)-N(2))-methyltransferase RsmD [Bacteroidales bacterium]